MQRTVRRLVLATLATLALTASVEPAVAASFRIERGGFISIPSVLSARFEASGATVECRITLGGTLSTALLAKVTGAQFGSITGMEIIQETCSGGTLEPRGILGLPWPLKYQSILGTLPERVTGMLFTVERMAFEIQVFGGFVRCLYSGDLGLLLKLSGSNPYSSRENILALEIRALASRFSLVRGSFCPAEGTWRADFRLSPAQTITRL